MKYKELQDRGVDLSPLGLLSGERASDYFCTPRGAEVLAWAGVDGIHVCTVKKFGEMIFAVNPMNLPNDYVHPIAKNTEDLLRLLLSVGDIAALEQAHGWSKERFDHFVAENPPSEEAKRALFEIAKAYSLTPMADAFAYIKALQGDFDYSAIPYKPDYAEWCPPPPKKTEWKVYFQGGVQKDGAKRRRKGEELPIWKAFSWGGEPWLVPSVYLCSEGLVVDVCAQIEPQRLLDFQEKWDFLLLKPLTAKMRERLEDEDPMNLSFRAIASVNGKPLAEAGGEGHGWIPDSCRPDGTENVREAQAYLSHYDLDGEMAWVFRRLFFPWKTAKKPQIKSISLTLCAQATRLSGEHFTVTAVGERFPLCHPVRKTEHTLTVTAYDAGDFGEILRDGEWEHPSKFRAMTYSLTPPLLRAEFSLRDCEENDPPRRRKKQAKRTEDAPSSVIGVIGGADGPTAAFAAASAPSPMCAGGAVVSALHFNERKQTEFRVVYYVKMRENLSVMLYDKEDEA